jgi:phospholipid transport system substrate-binding protein
VGAGALYYSKRAAYLETGGLDPITAPSGEQVMPRACARFGRRDLLAIAAGLLAVGPLAEPTGAVASSPSAEQVVQDLVEDIWATLNTNGVDESGRLDQLVTLFEARTDVGLISRLALGRYWNRLPEAQQQNYQELFREVVIRSFARRLNSYAEDAKGPLEERFQILSSAPAGKDDTLVRSKVFPRNGQPVALDWRLRAGNAGPVIIDLIVEGASLLVSQRSEFAAVIERYDLDGLLAELRARAASARS